MAKKILILEDEKEVAMIYKKLLKYHGYEVMLAFDGEEGLEKLKSYKPDLILLDLAMPKMSGIGFYEEICGEDDKPKYAILVLTGRIDLEASCNWLHVDGFLSKPFKGADLLKEIAGIFHKRARMKEMVASF